MQNDSFPSDSQPSEVAQAHKKRHERVHPHRPDLNRSAANDLGIRLRMRPDRRGRDARKHPTLVEQPMNPNRARISSRSPGPRYSGNPASSLTMKQ
jgi:hypothetical protein